MRADFRSWLERRPGVSVANTMSQVGRIQQAYGDLDALHAADGLAQLWSDLVYSTTDQRLGKANPSRIVIQGRLYDALASLRSALTQYRQFRRELDGEPPFGRPMDSDPGFGANHVLDEETQRWGLERDMQVALRRTLEQLDPDLTIIDGGTERHVPSGFIDILARDKAGQIVVVELKAGTARQGAVAQILSYMGDMAAEEAGSAVRGMLVAADFDPKARAAARMVPGLKLVSYAVRFQFNAVEA